MSEEEHDRGSDEASEESEETTDADAEERVQPKPAERLQARRRGGQAEQRCSDCGVLTPETIVLYDDARLSWTGPGARPVRVHIWRPPPGAPRPAVLVSHGSGGAAAAMAWLTESLAAAGFLVLWVSTTTGTTSWTATWLRASAAGWRRPLDATVVLDQLGEREEIGPTGAAGFSIGGYTAAALLGARVDADVYAALSPERSRSHRRTSIPTSSRQPLAHA